VTELNGIRKLACGRKTVNLGVRKEMGLGERTSASDQWNL
jgi:hypothetical protein